MGILAPVTCYDMCVAVVEHVRMSFMYSVSWLEKVCTRLKSALDIQEASCMNHDAIRVTWPDAIPFAECIF